MEAEIRFGVQSEILAFDLLPGTKSICQVLALCAGLYALVLIERYELKLCRCARSSHPTPSETDWLRI